MKIVVTRVYGEFRNPTISLDPFEVKSPFRYDRSIRCDPILVKVVENYRSNNNELPSLMVVDIPDESTDWIITDYNGVETVHYVVDGKIHSITPGYDDEEDLNHDR